MSEQPAESTESVELDVDEEKMEAWDEVKADYQIEPGGDQVPNAMDDAETTTAEKNAEEP